MLESRNWIGRSIIIFFLLLIPSTSLFAHVTSRNQKKIDYYKLLSPDERTCFEVKTAGGHLLYRVSYHSQRIINWSALGFVINGQTAGANTIIVNKKYTVHSGRFAWRLGEDDSILNNYDQLILNCRSNGLYFNLIIRAYNGSAAFRYEIPTQTPFNQGKISRELTAFDFPKVLTIYQYNQESVFTPLPVDSLKESCDLPATLTDYQHTYITIGEADNEDYTKAELTEGVNKNGLQLSFMHDSIVTATTDYQMPWRTISCATTAIGLHAYSQLYLKLVRPGSASIPAWIRPGKLIRSQLTTESGMRCVDFAAKYHFQYVLFDGGWYGPQRLPTSHPQSAIPEINLHKVIEYGREKGVGVILYVDYVELKAKIDTLLPLYKRWGVKGLKFGFVDGLTQNGISWLIKAVKKSTDAGFIVDVHDNYKPTGLSRKFPAWLTQEGIRGDEHGPNAFHTTTLPFTRFLAGPADFTFCYPNGVDSYSRNLRVSKAQQLALTVIYFSPLQSMLWYGRPENYTNERELEFFKYVPTVWDESHYVAGEISKYISVARRKGDVWFMGNAAGPEDWKDTVKLDFLKADITYQATIYEDGIKGGIKKRFIKLRKGDKFPISIKAKGGEAIILRPVEN